MEWRERLIKEEAEQLRVELTGGTLFGQPVDWCNLDRNTLLVAAYHAGYTKAQVERRGQDTLQHAIRDTFRA